MNEDIAEILEFIAELEEDSNMPKNVKAKFKVIVHELKTTSDDQLSLLVNKLLSDLDDISSDANLDQFTRQQIWSISSMLEGINI